jgi:hypothetical protein
LSEGVDNFSRSDQFWLFEKLFEVAIGLPESLSVQACIFIHPEHHTVLIFGIKGYRFSFIFFILVCLLVSQALWIHIVFIFHASRLLTTKLAH